MLDHYRDGDSNPLIWEFDTYLAKPSSASEPAWISYFKNVSNESTAEVRRVYWPVAHYYRRYLNPNSASPSCITMAGPTKPIPSIGPLYHGIAEHYDTNVREPLEGWKESDAGGIKPVFVQASAGRPLPPIESYFVVNTADTSPPQTATVKITSSAFETDNLLLQKSVLSYEFVSTGNAPVRLFVNLPQDETLAKAVPPIANLVLLEPNKPQKYFAVTDKRISLQQATVIFYDQAGKEIIAVESAGFYGLVDGKRQVDAEEFWRYFDR